MHHGVSGARVDEVAEGLAVFFKTLTVVTAGGDAEILQRDGLHGIARCGFRGLNADTPGFAVGRMADGGDFATDFKEEVGKAVLFEQRDQFVDHEAFGDAGDIDAEIGKVLF